MVMISIQSSDQALWDRTVIKVDVSGRLLMKLSAVADVDETCVDTCMDDT